MARRKTWNYSDAANTSTGTMVCTACGNPIETGEYRYRETAEAFHNQHRGCSSSDPGWSRVDRARAERLASFDAKKCAFIEFFEKWGVSSWEDVMEDDEMRALAAARSNKEG